MIGAIVKACVLPIDNVRERLYSVCLLSNVGFISRSGSDTSIKGLKKCLIGEVME